MHPVHAFAALAMTGCAAALPQSIPLDEVAAIPGAPIEKVPTGDGAGTQTVPYAPDPVVSGTFASVLADPASASKKVERRGWDCSEQPLGKGPVPSPDTPEAFLAMEDLSNAANNAPVPSGYALKFKNLKASNNAIGYLGYNTLDTYDTQACADFCTAKDGCSSFNIYFERDPSVVPADACSNPSSTTVIKCVMWGSYIGPSTAVNDGQWRNDFHVVIAGSNGYVDERVPTVAGYSGEFLDNVAINAPSDCNGDDTYMGYKLFNDGKPFDAARCAAACEAETQYNLEHLNGRMLCKFFNTYVLNKNGEPQGQYCSMYTQKWDKTYAVNNGQWRGDDHYTIEYSYSFSNTTDPGKPKLPCDVAAAKSAIVASSLQPFCSTLLGYNTAVSTVVTTEFTTVPASTLVTTISPVTTTTTTVTPAVTKRNISPATPAALASFDPTVISSACSLEATPVTETTTTSTTTVATVSSGTVTTTTTLPVSTTTATATATPASKCAAPGVNVIQNPGFDDMVSPWSPWQQNQYDGRVPTSWGVDSNGFKGRSYWITSAGDGGFAVNLFQNIWGLTLGATYTLSYKYSYAQPGSGQIICSANNLAFNSLAITGDASTVNQWLTGPDPSRGSLTTFVAQSTSMKLNCIVAAAGAQTVRIDEVSLTC